MKDYSKWQRLNLDERGAQPLDDIQKSIRRIAEEETSNDMRKSIQQLVCDVHEEVLQVDRDLRKNLNHAIKRMVSMMGRVALTNTESSDVLVRFTKVLLFLTIALVVLTVLLLIMTVFLAVLTTIMLFKM